MEIFDCILEAHGNFGLVFSHLDLDRASDEKARSVRLELYLVQCAPHRMATPTVLSSWASTNGRLQRAQRAQRA